MLGSFQILVRERGKKCPYPTQSPWYQRLGDSQIFGRQFFMNKGTRAIAVTLESATYELGKPIGKCSKSDLIALVDFVLLCCGRGCYERF